jgi:hypothetical protein
MLDLQPHGEEADRRRERRANARRSFLSPLSVASWGGVVAVTLGATIYILATGRSPRLWVFVTALTIPLAIGVVDAWRTFIAARLLRKILRDHGGLICRNCHYPLPHNLSAGNCPECGKPYTLAEVRAAWKS